MNKKLICFVLCSVSVILIIVISFFSITEIAYQTSASNIEFKPTIIIDPGHGGEDGGASTENGILEKDINLSISLMLRDYLQTNGFDVIMSRDSDVSLHENNTSVSRKRSDLKNRVKLFNSSQNNIVISIHQNKFTDSRYFGAQVFYSPNDIKSESLAQCIKNSIKSLKQPDNERECKKASSEILILNESKVPSILVECGFLSNSDESKKLCDLSYQNDMAYCIFLGFMEYYYTNY